MTPLERARDAAKAGDLAAARAALIEAWRARRSPALAELVELVDAKLPPDDVRAAIAAIVAPRAATSAARLAALRAVDDPRLARFAIEALVAPPFTTPTARDFLVALVAVAKRHRDPRLIERSPAIVEALGLRIGRLAVRGAILGALARATRTIPELARATPRGRELEAEIAALLDGLRGSSRSADTLLADIYANPCDDGPRLVYADLLAEAGDPRGEFVALQLARARDVAPGERELALLKQHGKAWLGKLAPVLSWGRGYSHTTFARGFVACADIILSVGNKLRPIYTDPMWSTVERLEGNWDFDLLERAPLRAVRSLSSYLTIDIVEKLATRAEPLPLEMLTINVDWDRGRVVHPATIAKAFPNLRELSIYREITTLDDVRAFAAIGIRRLTIDHFSHTEGLRAKADAAYGDLRRALAKAEPCLEILKLRPPWSGSPGPDPAQIWPA